MRTFRGLRCPSVHPFSYFLPVFRVDWTEQQEYIFISASFLFVDLLLFKRARISRTRWVQRESAVHRGHQQEGRLDTAESDSVQRQRHLLLWREEPARREGDAGSNRAQGGAERWAFVRFVWPSVKRCECSNWRKQKPSVKGWVGVVRNGGNERCSFKCVLVLCGLGQTLVTCFHPLSAHTCWLDGEKTVLEQCEPQSTESVVFPGKEEAFLC